MGFDVNKFETTNFKYREKDVDVPELKDWFPPKEKPIWKIRNLDGIELANVRDAVSRNQNLEKLIEHLASNLSKDKAKIVSEAFGFSSDTPDDYVRRLNVLKLGSIDPDLKKKHNLCVKLADTFPVTFSRITDEIMILTGSGKLGESTASGTTKK